MSTSASVHILKHMQVRELQRLLVMQTQSCRPHHPNSVRQVAVSFLEVCRCVTADENLPQIMFTVEETAARREADCLQTSHARTEETAGEAAVRREEVNVTRLLQGTVRDS